MTECNFCSDNVTMPFTCSLCSQKHCSKHRLPESHQCPNIGHFDTDMYRKQKLAKASIPRNASTIGDFAYTESVYGSRFNFWSSGYKYRDITLAGVLIGIISIMPGIFSRSNIIDLPWILLYSIFGMFAIYYVRNETCHKYGLETNFRFWPIGIAITFIFALFRPFWILIGYFFVDGEGSARSRGIIGIISTLTAMGIFLFSILILIIAPDLESTGFWKSSYLFLWISLLNMLPLWGLDGQRIYEWDPKNYWLMLILTISFVIFFLFL